MQKHDNHLKFIISHAKSYGFIFPSSQIYEGINSIYDYGPYGVLLKNNLKLFWWKSMVDIRSNIVGIDSSILMNSSVWKASGHLSSFHDLLIDNKTSKKRYRVDFLIEKYCNNLKKKINKEIKKINNKKYKGDKEECYEDINYKINDYKKKIKNTLFRMNNSIKNRNLNDIKNLIDELEIIDEYTGSKNWTEVRQFNLMFKTEIGALEDKKNLLYMRPETAQGIFVNFIQVQKSTRMKIPFGIAQIGKAFRNEIISRQFIFRMKEFEQMEMQFFIQPCEENKWYEYWKESRMKWHLSLGLGKEKYRFRDHNKLSHYSNKAIDIEFLFPFGFKELEGIHSRTNFDLKNHQIHSGKKMEYFDSKKKLKYIPYVIETSIGLDRLFLGVLSSCLCKETLEDKSIRSVLKLPFFLSPIKAAIFPLVKKDNLPEIAKKIFNELKWKYNLIYEEKESIGKRYRRQDSIGTPFCFTIDYKSLEDYSVTIRYRDTMNQKRIFISKIDEFLKKEINIIKTLKSSFL